MSLIERVRTVKEQNAQTLSNEKNTGLDVLKHQVNQHISSDEIASIMVENPSRARNEIRSVCERVFENGTWTSSALNDKETLIENLINEVFGFGPLEKMINDESITEIMVNGAHSIFYERGGKLFSSSHVFTNDEQVRALIDRIISPLGKRLDEASPMVNARLAQGHRVHAIIPPLSLDGPIVTIRKFREHLYTLAEMVHLKTIDKRVEQFLVWAIKARKNIAVSGGTGSGKTTLLNALSCVIPSTERIITIEDSAELKFSYHPHVVRLESRPRNAEGTGEITIRDLVINALRMRPDRIIVGECRGEEALDMLQAMNTGHDGSLTTLHANSPTDALMRLATMVRYGADLPIEIVESQIVSALDLIVQIVRAADGHRYLCEIVSLGCAQKDTANKVVSVFRKNDKTGKGEWFSLPHWIDHLPFQGIATKEEVHLWKQSILWSA